MILGGDRQLCMGQKGGVEHAIHSLRDAFKTQISGRSCISTKKRFQWSQS